MGTSMELSMGTFMKLPMQKSIETRYDTVKFEKFSFHWKCFKEKGKFKIYLRYEKQWMVLFGHGNLKLVKKKMPFHLNHRTNQSARLIIMVSLDVGEH